MYDQSLHATLSSSAVRYVRLTSRPDLAADLGVVRFPPRPCEKAMFKSLCGSGPEARLGLLAV